MRAALGRPRGLGISVARWLEPVLTRSARVATVRTSAMPNADGGDAASARCVAAMVTTPNREVATSLARALLGKRLCACVNLVPGIESLYVWDGAVQQDKEVLMVIKSTEAKLPEIADVVANLHPYDVPEVVGMPIVGGHAPYLDWVRKETAAPPFDPP